MFTDEFCDNWESTKNQDDFIENYFSKRTVNLTKVPNLLESVDKSQNINATKNSTNKSFNRRSLNYEYNKKKIKEKQSLPHYSEENCSEMSSPLQNVQVIESDLKSNHLKNKKKIKKNRNILNKSSEQINIADSTSEAKIMIDNLSTDSIKNNIQSDSDCLEIKKKNKRKKAKSISEKSSVVPVTLHDETKTISNALFSDSSLRDNDLSESSSFSNCPKVKKRKKKLKNTEKSSKLVGFSDEEQLACFETSHDLSVKISYSPETSNNTLINDSSIKENNLSKNHNSDYLKMKKKKSKNKQKNTEKISESEDFFNEAEPVSFESFYNLAEKKNNLLQNKAYQKLQAAKFRYLNEMLYTNSGKDAFSYFQQNTDEFIDYHVGYQSQVSKWPINPVDIMIQELSQINKQAVIADLGCGQAKIAEVFPKRTVHSFDLIALKDCVTACDMANVPLPSNSVDVVVFCLSLMGTNWKDYLKEACRMLKLGGIMKIAEIESRIENFHYFVKEIENSGFSLINENLSHKMFVFLNFKRVNKSKKSSKVPDVTLKPCLYKKR